MKRVSFLLICLCVCFICGAAYGQQDAPDIAVTGVDISGRPQIGQSITFTVHVKNVGQSAIPRDNFIAVVYRLVNASGSPVGMQGNCGIPLAADLGAGQSVDISNACSVYTNDPGDYRLEIKRASITGELGSRETNVGNNTFSIPFRVEAGFGQLAIADIIVPQTDINVNDEATMSYTVVNVGSGPAQSVTIQAELCSADGQVTYSNWNPEMIQNIGPGSTVPHTVRFKFSNAGTFTLKVTATIASGNPVTKNSRPITVRQSPVPDIAVEILGVTPEHPKVNESFHFTVRVTNAGTAVIRGDTRLSIGYKINCLILNQNRIPTDTVVVPETAFEYLLNRPNGFGPGEKQNIDSPALKIAESGTCRLTIPLVRMLNAGGEEEERAGKMGNNTVRTPFSFKVEALLNLNLPVGFPGKKDPKK